MDVMISIIVPIYKVEKYLPQCIESIVNQTYSNLEIILVNDGSPDRCGEICDKYAENDNRIKVVHKPNGGLVSARKAGVQIASGEYIAFVDGDDWIDKTLYQEMNHCLNSDDIDIVCAGFIQVNGDERVKYSNHFSSGTYDRSDIKNIILPELLCIKASYESGIVSAVWNKLFKTELIKDCIFSIDEKVTLGEDAICSYSCIINANKIIICNEVYGYYYRYNIEAMTKAYDKKYLYHAKHLFLELDRIMKGQNETIFEEQLLRYKIHIIWIGAHKEIDFDRRVHFISQIKFYRCLTRDIVFKKILEKVVDIKPLLQQYEIKFFEYLYNRQLFRAFILQVMPKTREGFREN